MFVPFKAVAQSRSVRKPLNPFRKFSPSICERLVARASSCFRASARLPSSTLAASAPQSSTPSHPNFQKITREINTLPPPIPPNRPMMPYDQFAMETRSQQTSPPRPPSHNIPETPVLTGNTGPRIRVPALLVTPDSNNSRPPTPNLRPFRRHPPVRSAVPCLLTAVRYPARFPHESIPVFF